MDLSELVPIAEELCPKRMDDRKILGEESNIRKYLGLRY